MVMTRTGLPAGKPSQYADTRCQSTPGRSQPRQIPAQAERRPRLWFRSPKWVEHRFNLEWANGPPKESEECLELAKTRAEIVRSRMERGFYGDSGAYSPDNAHVVPEVCGHVTRQALSVTTPGGTVTAGAFCVPRRKIKRPAIARRAAAASSHGGRESRSAAGSGAVRSSFPTATAGIDLVT